MTCHEAPACRAVLTQATKRAPHRHTGSDGICASAAHHDQNPGSDHEPHVRLADPADGRLKDWATAVDVTDDKPGGMDADAWADWLVVFRHPCVKYVIRNRQMASSYPAHGYPAWTWRPYTGPNPHTTHTHVSIHPTSAAVFYDGPWFPSSDEDDMATWKDWSAAEKADATKAIAAEVVKQLTAATDENSAGGRIKRATRASERTAKHFGIDLGD